MKKDTPFGKSSEKTKHEREVENFRRRKAQYDQRLKEMNQRRKEERLRNERIQMERGNSVKAERIDEKWGGGVKSEFQTKRQQAEEEAQQEHVRGKMVENGRDPLSYWDESAENHILNDKVEKPSIFANLKDKLCVII